MQRSRVQISTESATVRSAEVGSGKRKSKWEVGLARLRVASCTASVSRCRVAARDASFVRSSVVVVAYTGSGSGTTVHRVQYCTV